MNGMGNTLIKTLPEALLSETTKMLYLWQQTKQLEIYNK